MFIAVVNDGFFSLPVRVHGVPQNVQAQGLAVQAQTVRVREEGKTVVPVPQMRANVLQEGQHAKTHAWHPP